MIDILVPVLERPGSAQPLVDSIEAHTSVPHRTLFLCSPQDEAQKDACMSTGAEVIIVDWPAGKADFARKINCGFRETEAPWVFQAADDLRFHPYWAEQALLVARNSGAGVVGTNDLGNPLVKRGGHSTHSLFSRAYITAYGGTVDGSGIVFSEAYDHQYTDNEFCQTAMRRGKWAFAKNAVVEHLHPHWGKAEMDPTYRKGLKQSHSDRRLYLRRMRSVRRDIVAV